MPSTHKKVLVRKLDRETLAGVVNPETFLREDHIELLSPQGLLLRLPLEQVKGVYFVRSHDIAASQLERRTFSTRPRLDGLWIRARFHDQEILEGVLPNELLDLTPIGFSLIPPDVSAGVQRVFVPRSALAQVRVLGVIGGQKGRHARRGPLEEQQIDLFT